MRSLVSWLLTHCRVDVAGDAERIVDPPGEKTEPFAVVSCGVTVPDSLGEAAVPFVGRDVVEANRFESEALLRRYGRFGSEERGERGARFLTFLIDAD